MARYWSLLVVIVSVGILKIVNCGKDPLNPISPKLNKQVELKNSLLSEGKKFLFENNKVPLEGKIFEKRRLLFKEGEAGTVDRELENEYSARRRANYSLTETETETQIPEHQKAFGNWEYKQINRLLSQSESGNSRHQEDFHLGQPLTRQSKSRHNLNRGPRVDIFETRQSPWNGERNVEQNTNAEGNPRIREYDGGLAHRVNDPGENGESIHRRLSMTTLTDQGMAIPENYNGERVTEINPGHFAHHNMRYYNRNPKTFWNPVYGPEKGVIINFNTECPVPRQLSNQMVHKFIFTPKSPINTLPEISPFQVPESGFISGQKMTPLYYLQTYN